MKTTKSFRVCGTNGFHIAFPNGYTVSVQMGPGTYSSNYNEMFDGRRERPKEDRQADVVEVAVFALESREWYHVPKEVTEKGGEDVMEYMTLADVMRVLAHVAELLPVKRGK